MTKLLLRRLLWSIPLLFVASALSFVLLSLTSGSPAEVILGQRASAEQVAALNEKLGLNESVWNQYWHWLNNALHGDLGSSLISGESVTSLLSRRPVVSLTLIIGATVVASVVGVLAGVWAATKGGPAGKTVEAGAVFGLAVPNFLLAIVLIQVFAVTLRIFPTSGLPLFADDPAGWAKSLVLPVIALAVGALTIVAVQTRDSMREALRSDFIRVLEANGISRRSVLYRHALRNAAIPIVTAIGLLFVGLLGGTVLVESIFSMPGLGSAMALAAEQRDIPVVQGGVLYFTAVVVVVNLLVDITYGLLNPRVRVS